MQITVTTVEGELYPLDVSDDLPIEDLKALMAMEIGTDPSTVVLIHNMAPLTREKDSLTACGVKDGDIIVISTEQSTDATATTSQSVQNTTSSDSTTGQLPRIDWSSIRVEPSNSPAGPPQLSLNTGAGPRLPQSPVAGGSDDIFNNPETLVQHFLSNPEELVALRQRDPHLAEAIASGDSNWIKEALMVHGQRLRELELERQQLEGYDPMSSEYQERLAENIRQRNIRENIEAAIEFNPEIFAGSVAMLYLECKVNGKSVKALVDTGAQMTVMNSHCAERCDIMRLVDRRLAGYAFGVGRQRIIGTIHLGQIQIGNDFLASSFRVLEDQSHELILGLDMLKRHQCIIDLSRNVLRVGTTGTEASFLSGNEVKELAAVYQQEMKGAIEDEDRQMASIIARSEQEYKDKTGELPPKSPPPPPSFPEESIQRILAAGFTRDEAIRGLQDNNGDVQKTLAILLARSIRL